MSAELEADLDALLVSWRKSRAPEIADAIDVASEALTAKEIPISSKAAWWAAFEENRSANVGRLLDAAPDGMDSAARLEAFLQRPLDPRVGTFARTWLTEPPVERKHRAPFFLAVAKVLEPLGDVRTKPILEELAADRSLAIARCGLANYKHLVALARADLEAPIAVDPETAETIAQVDAVLNERKPRPNADPADFFAQVYADPTDDAARAVLADLLTERDDPRGEFIALQLARFGKDIPPALAERKLQNAWGRAWLGGIEPAVLLRDLTFERGFVRSLCLAQRHDVEPLLASPEWATVEEMEVIDDHRHEPLAMAELLRSSAFRNVRHVTGIPRPVLPMLTGLPLPWRTVGVRVAMWDGVTNLELRTFPEMKKLVVSGNDLSPFATNGREVAGRLADWPQIDELEIQVHPSWFADVLATPNARRLRRIAFVIQTQILRWDRETKTLAFAPCPIGTKDRLEDSHADAFVSNIDAAAPARIELTLPAQGKLVNDALVYREGSMNLAPIRAAASKVGAKLFFQGKPV